MCEIPKAKVQLGILSFLASPLIAIQENDKVIEHLEANQDILDEVKRTQNKLLKKKTSEECNTLEDETQNDKAKLAVDSSKYLEGRFNESLMKNRHDQTFDEVEIMDMTTPMVGQDQIVDDNACNSFERKDVHLEPDGNSLPSSECDEGSKTRSQPVNVFNFMMDNRHKQDEVIKKMAEEEKLKEDIEDTLCFGQTSVPSKEFTPIQPSWKENESCLTFSPQSAFAMLMPTKKKQVAATTGDKDDPDYDPFSEIFVKKSKISRKSHKRLTKILDSSLEDFEEIFSASRPTRSSNSKHVKNDFTKEKPFSPFDSDLSAGDDSPSVSDNKNASAGPSKLDYKKLDLVTDEEEPLLEETFKDEILECVSGSKKKTRKKRFSKGENGIYNDKRPSKRKPKCPKTSECVSISHNLESLPIDESKATRAASCSTTVEAEKGDQSSSVQAGILSYFKQVAKKENSNFVKKIEIQAEIHVPENQDKVIKKANHPKLSKSELSKPKKLKKNKSLDLNKISIEETIEDSTEAIVVVGDVSECRNDSSSSSVHCFEYNGIKIDEIVKSTISEKHAYSSDKDIPNELDVTTLIKDKENVINSLIDGKKKCNSNDLFSIFHRRQSKKSITSSLRNVRVFDNCNISTDQQSSSFDKLNCSVPISIHKTKDCIKTEPHKTNSANCLITSTNITDLDADTSMEVRNNPSKAESSNCVTETKSEIVYDVEESTTNSLNALQEEKQDNSIEITDTSEGINLDDTLPLEQTEDSTPDRVRRSSRKMKKRQPFESYSSQEIELKIYKMLQKKDKNKLASNLKNDSSDATECCDSKIEDKSNPKASRRLSKKEKRLQEREGGKEAPKKRKRGRPPLLGRAHRKKVEEQPPSNDTDLDSSCGDIIVLESPEMLNKKDSEFANKNDEKKLAPIFAKKNSQNEKASISPSKLKARHDFLFSDVPDEVKKCPSLVQSSEDQDLWPCFPSVSHVTQSSEEDKYFHLHNPNIQNLVEEEAVPVGLDLLQTNDRCSQSLIDKGVPSPSPDINASPSLSVSTLCHILFHLKNKNPSFPVYSVFKSFLDSKEEAVNLYKKELEADQKSDKKSQTIPQCEFTPEKSKRKRKSRKLSTNKRRRLNKLNRTIEADFELGEENNNKSEIPLWHQWIPFGWNQVFAPKSSINVIGNSGLVSQLKQWLEDWKKNIELQTAKDKPNHPRKGGDDDSDSNYSDNGLMNTLLLSGPSGIGKTCSVYAIAQDLGFEVLEVNASSRRQGKQVMSQLSEATQSHIVSSGSSFSLGNHASTSTSHAPGSSKHHEKRKNRDSKQQSCVLFKGNNLAAQNRVENIQDNEKKKNMALILFKDIDIVFEESDDGFLSTVSSFMSTTKRPIILTTSNPTPCSKARIKGNFSELTFTRPKPEDVAQYLQLMCLAASGVFSSAKEVEALVASNKGDIRKTILDLQFWSLSGSCKVQWLKMDCKSFSKAKNMDKGDDINLSQIFTNYSLRKSVEVPISLGSSWSRSDLEDFKESRHLGNNWSLVSSNIVSLLPFNLKLKDSPVHKFPLKENDPTVMKTSLWQRHFWLSLDSDSESEKETIEEEEEKKETPPEEKYPPEVKTVATKCIHSLSNFYNSLANLDVLNSKCIEIFEDCKDLNKWWRSLMTSELEWVTDKHDITPNYASLCLVADLSSSLAAIGYQVLHREIQRHLRTIDCRREWPPLTIPVETIPPSLFLHSHQFASICHHHRWNTVNQKIVSCLPLLSQPQRTAVARDYMPFIRSFTRSDQMGEAVQRVRRGRRFLSHMKQLGFYLSTSECIDLSNIF